MKILLKITIFLILTAGVATSAESEFIIVQSTTSTQNSGLYEYLAPKVLEETGVEIRVVAVGTGQAIKNAQNCDGDVLLVHAKAAEEKFVAGGFGGPRHDLMYNDFVIVGPDDDPAGVAGSSDIIEALGKLFAARGPFVSRGDDSGTHKKEMQLWSSAALDPEPASGDWYRETGSGMGATLNIAAGMGAYTMTDRATWLTFGNKKNLKIVVEGDDRLFNQYGIMPVSKQNCPNVKANSGQRFVDWMLSPQGQSAIAAYKVNGEQLFFPNANP
ncbi:MAG: substrate-binding domain-containing protein [Rhizobiaceae bacterium]